MNGAWLTDSLHTGESRMIPRDVAAKILRRAYRAGDVRRDPEVLRYGYFIRDWQALGLLEYHLDTWRPR